MFSYGWVFQTGLFNFYLSIGLALAALSALWTREVRGKVMCLLLSPLIVLAHPLGFVVFVVFAALEQISRRFSTRGVATAFVIAVASIVATRWYLLSHYHVSFSDRPFWMTTGPDQLALYAPIYLAIALVVLILFVAQGLEAIVLRYPLPKNLHEKLIFVGTLYLLLKIALWLLPDEVSWKIGTARASLLVNRATLLCAILVLAIMAILPAHKWKTWAWTVVTSVFFIALYYSTGNLSRLQSTAMNTVRALPPGVRLTASGFWQPSLGVINPHLAERACVQHCFVISNYEIASNQFRIRSDSANSLVAKKLTEIDQMQRGSYVVKTDDLPLFSLHACGPLGGICLGRLAAGDQNGHPSIEFGTPNNPPLR
jgi:hypothetical protein